jgi:signal peptidase I
MFVLYQFLINKRREGNRLSCLLFYLLLSFCVHNTAVADAIKSKKPSSRIYKYLEYSIRSNSFIPFKSIVETFIRPYKTPSHAMSPALEPGDHIFVNNISYGLAVPFHTVAIFEFRSPSRGDVVVFTRPDDSDTDEDESQITMIKRVIALPGETVEIKNEKVLINNSPLREDYAFWNPDIDFDSDFPKVTVPKNKVFLLGDNRKRSKDSRHYPGYFIDTSRIKGRAFMIYFSPNSFIKNWYYLPKSTY